MLDERDYLSEERKAEEGLTVFIPAWNHRPYLPRSLRSALSALDALGEADYPGEILVIDDASRDGSQKLLRAVQALYGEGQLRTLFLERNIGVARVRNLALRLARFRYVCMLDADNELVPENMPLFVRSVIETGAALLYGNLIAREGGEPVRLKSSQRATMQILRGQGSQIDTFALVDAEKLLRVGGYDPRFFSGSDWELVLHLIAEEQTIVFVPTVLGYYYINPMSVFREAKPRWDEIRAMAWRTYAQTGRRGWDPLRIGRVYHPAVGFIDEP